MPKYVKARQGPKNSVIYTDDSSENWIFEGGLIPWRNQNPGDLRPGACILSLLLMGTMMIFGYAFERQVEGPM